MLKRQATYNHRPMVGWSFSLGNIFGVEVRLHSFFLFLLIGSMSWASYLELPMMRGVGLWFLLVLALAVRETARGFAAGWLGIDVKTLAAAADRRHSGVWIA